MEITRTLDGGALMLSLSGALDAEAELRLAAEWKNVEDSVTNLVIDMECVEYIESPCLRQILLAERMMQKRGSLTIIRAPENVRNVFRITGLSERLNILS